MLQAIGEGVELLHKGGNGFNLDLAKIFKNWSNGSVIRGWLICYSNQMSPWLRVT